MNTLIGKELHPAAYHARQWIANLASADPVDIMLWRESFASSAIEGDRLSAICGETLERLLNGEPVGDRYVLGLAWVMKCGLEAENAGEEETDSVKEDH